MYFLGEGHQPTKAEKKQEKKHTHWGETYHHCIATKGWHVLKRFYLQRKSKPGRECQVDKSDEHML